jgi:hypothetical protein
VTVLYACPTCGDAKPTTGRCARCATPSRRVYNHRLWRGPGGCRDRTLAKAGGLCQWPGCEARATIADHFPIPLAAVLRHGLNPYDDANTRALCHKHSGEHDGGRQ